MTRSFRCRALALLLASSIVPAALAGGARAQPAPRAEAQPTTQLPAPPQTLPAPPPVAPQFPRWRAAAAEELLSYVEGIGREGIDPEAYAPQALREAIARGDATAGSQIAGQMFLRLTADLSGGFVRGDGRVGWHMPDNAIDGNRQQQMLAEAAQGGAARLLDALLPTHPQYVGLRNALAATPEDDTARRELIRANMERWRWMPRNLGARHVIVNVPAFTAALVQDGHVVVRHRAIVGARRTPTPQLAARITAVTFNPSWYVPQSIINEMGGRFSGYEVRRLQDGKIYVRQPPGPTNALGRLKIEMPNEHSIYLHDTPAQALFDRPVRAFSHGCIRTHNVRNFAAALLAPMGQWDRAAIDRAIAEGETSQATLPEPIPVYIAYFTAAATNDGNIVTYADIYGRDAPVRQALNGAAAPETEVASSGP